MTHVKPAQVELTAEDLYQFSGSDKRYELVNGALRVSEPVGSTHGRLALRLAARLLAVVEPARLGEVYQEVGFVLRRRPDIVRGPDVAFLRTERLPADDVAHRFIEGPPDLAVEVLSPDDRPGEVAEKVDEYLTYGTRLVWVVDPSTEHVGEHTPDGASRVLRSSDALDGGAVVPGFRWTVAELFAPRAERRPA